MGKTERRNVSQKKKSPVRTTLKLRKEKKMKGGELTDGEIDKIKDRDQDGIKESILGAVERYVTNMNDQLDTDQLDTDKLDNMIKAYFDKDTKIEDFSKNYRTIIIEVIPRLNTLLENLKKIKIPRYESEIKEYNNHNILIQNVNDFIKIMKAIAEGAKIKIAAEDGTAKSGADDATIDIDGLNEGLNKIGRIFVIGNMKENDNINVYEKLAPTARIIMAYMVEISQEKQTELDKAMNNLKIEQAINKIKKQDQPEHDILGFLSNTDIRNLLEDKGIISESDIQNATQSLSELESNVNELFQSVDNEMFAPVTSAQITQPVSEANKQIDENRKKFVEIVQYLLDLVTKIKKKVTFATTGTAASDDKSDDKYATTGTGKSGADESDTNISDTNITDASEIAKLNTGLNMINNIFTSSKGIARNDENELFEKLNPVGRVINAYLIKIHDEKKIKLKKFVDDGKPETLFFKNEDIEPLLKGELIITETDITNARDRLSQLNSDVNNSLKNKVIDNSKKYSIKKPEYVLKQDTFKQKINFLINLLNEIQSKVSKIIEDTTSDASATNEIKEINNIIIDSDEELVTLNITDQEGHIIYSYILRFTREGNGVTIVSGNDSDSDKKVVENVQVTNVSSTDSNELEVNEDTNVSESDSDNDSNVSEVNEDTTGIATDSDSNESEEEEDVKYFGGRDSINDRTEMPTTVLTAEINKQFSINGKRFIISN